LIACKSIGDCKFIVLVVRSSIPLTNTIINDVLHVDVVHGDDKPCQPSLMPVPLVVCGNDWAHIFYSGECDDGLWIVTSCHMKHVSTCYYNLSYYNVANCHSIVCGMFPINYCNKDWIGGKENTCTENVRDNDSWKQSYYVVETTRKYYF